jgi:WD40 repeat protein
MNKYFLLVFTTACLTQISLAQKTFSDPDMVLPGHSNDVTKIAFSPKGDILASGSWDKSITIYSCNDSVYELKTTLSGHNFPITALKFRNDGNMLASGSADNAIVLWDSIWRNVGNLSGHTDQVNDLLFDRTGKYLFSGSDDRTVLAWDTRRFKSFKKIDVGFAVTSLAQSNDPRFLFVAGSNPQIRLYSLTNGQIVKTFDGHGDAVNSIAISPNNKLMISGSNDKTARIWDLLTGKQLRVLPVDCWKVTAVAFSADSKYVVTGCNDGSIKVWDVNSGELISKIEATGQYIKDISFNKVSTQILVAATIKNSTDFGVRVWPSGLEKATAAVRSNAPGKTQPAKRPTTPRSRK